MSKILIVALGLVLIYIAYKGKGSAAYHALIGK